MNLDYLTLQKEICNKIKFLDFDGAKKHYEKLSNLFHEIKLSYNFEICSIKNHLVYFINYLNINLSLNTDIEYTLHTTAFELIKDLDKINNKSELLKYGNVVIDTFSFEISHCCINSNKTVLKSAVEIINENLSKNLNLEFVSNQIHVSKNYLSFCFTKDMGIKFTEYIKKLRVYKAKHLLTNTNYSMHYIATICGFKTQSYFSYVFKEVTGLSPLNFKNTFSK
ncbi:AraC family transcriptional regulator [Clostridium senegalense]|uniref:helix-turn-helix domain-containing protein n=1 Tax=Clostridium senegalense TaxID=1465809 RepID=UPI001C11493B|nr:AraC family transcriptional regulator [Clostridium senegalense]MBU5228326.1 AraC family transcriptional regulator [Clostridium senegalense]